MRLRILSAILLIGSCCLPSQAGEVLDVGSRHVRHYVRPMLPEIARKMNLRGAVKLEVEIAPDGRVTTVKALGGHPLLVDGASQAVKSWQFDITTQPTVGELTIVFE